VVMCGPAFSGKTTLSMTLAARMGALRVSCDEINHERGLPPGGAGLQVEEWQRSFEDAQRRVREAMVRREPVVVDDTCCFRFLRDDWRRIAEDNKYRCRLVHIRITEAELWRRLHQNRLLPKRDDIRDDLFSDHIKTFEYPTPDEAAEVFDPDVHMLDSWIESFFSRA